jgi:8'-apo-carotenoid 13,14-cleaving dioxygenase
MSEVTNSESSPNPTPQQAGFSRRQILGGAAALAGAAFLAACSTTKSASETTTSETIGSEAIASETTDLAAPLTEAASSALEAPPTSALTATAGVVAASKYLSGNYGPVSKEVTALDLKVTGKIPEGLSGYFIRNGPNSISPPPEKYQWLIGDGMLHIVELDGGKASSYRNRWLRVPSVAKQLGEPEPTGLPAPNGFDISNTSTAKIGNRLYSTTEGTYPYEFTPDGKTVERAGFGGALTHGLSAHSKYDPITRETHSISYRGTEAPFAVWHVINDQGVVTKTLPLEVPGSSMIHTTTLTPKHVLVYDLPVTFSMDAAQAGWSYPYGWNPNYQARLGVIDRATAAVKWIDIPPSYVFHDAGSYDTDTGLVVDVAAYPKLLDGDLGGPGDNGARLERWTVDLVTGTVKQQVLDDRTQEFPRYAPSMFGKPNRYTYAVASSNEPTLFGVLASANLVVKHDHEKASSTQWSPGKGRSAAEATFVPDESRGADEDAGWLMAFVYDASTDGSELVILDAKDVTAGPVATIQLPQRVPLGFHGNWFTK